MSWSYAVKNARFLKIDWHFQRKILNWRRNTGLSHYSFSSCVAYLIYLPPMEFSGLTSQNQF